MEEITANLYVLIQEIYTYDAHFALKLLEITENIETMDNIVYGKDIEQNITNIESIDSFKLPNDCFKRANAKTLLNLNLLRAQVYTLEIFIIENIDEHKRCNSLLNEVHKIMNIIAHMIYTIIGGENVR